MPHLPGYTALRSITPRDIMYTYEGEVLEPGGVIISSAGYDGANTGYEYELRAGWLLGKITASGLYVPCKRTQVNGTSGASTAVVVDNSYAFVVGDIITIDSDTDIEITAIDYTTHTLTIASTTVADNDAVFAQDGSQTCVGISPDFVSLRDVDNAVAINASSRFLTAGHVKTSMIYGDYAAIIADTTSANNLRLIHFHS